MDTADVDAGHVWVVAPPFNVIDLTVRFQGYPQKNSNYIPEYILGDSYLPVGYTVEDVCSPAICSIFNAQKIYNDDMIFLLHPEKRILYKEFVGSQIVINGVKFKYIPCAINASDKPLEDITTLNLNGRYGIEIYNDLLINI